MYIPRTLDAPLSANRLLRRSQCSLANRYQAFHFSEETYEIFNVSFGFALTTTHHAFTRVPVFRRIGATRNFLGLSRA